MYRSSYEMTYLAHSAVPGGGSCGGLWLSTVDRGKFLDRNGRETFEGGQLALNNSSCDPMLACNPDSAE